MTMITPSYLGETIEYSSLHACRSTLEDPTDEWKRRSRPDSRSRLERSGAARRSAESRSVSRRCERDQQCSRGRSPWASRWKSGRARFSASANASELTSRASRSNGQNCRSVEIFLPWLFRSGERWESLACSCGEELLHQVRLFL